MNISRIVAVFGLTAIMLSPVSVFGQVPSPKQWEVSCTMAILAHSDYKYLDFHNIDSTETPQGEKLFKNDLYMLHASSCQFNLKEGKLRILLHRIGKLPTQTQDIYLSKDTPVEIDLTGNFKTVIIIGNVYESTDYPGIGVALKTYETIYERRPEPKVGEDLWQLAVPRREVK
ncbi:MAG: hypothetical protein A3B91_00270 [Candidatus Yanofskybacteria bacterium RIFCSPHIGHO2_02_FULL_41_29]|uniref:Uncharacterized protein n=1 Tax=Candidatus Yanofskybacteria bacterium RIFCSPHIGHO2_01_FULL_41_53 TaxID=1802663 RepID=A0A1F8EHK7_9BACT|nr:MAG: hypothetical protein A2650_01815 [Candidatus Yanofskybacteria bacterium RIFCSPHIGHO2_01_FULL_41_53]OGN11583.1 MAG: hypothetical protein A3B91_00270 [Candidatus Yanofskybacteria bacterium RIFCSPHIGHO2_02_FULL_41_29]OGN18838.1 MAG: hypothetical protein A3F48_02815 [Candidatus Yanofskybacteria bacterium RIFCSPHIGHO2_12_FULL_41_9]OGN22819.1 MAG: hypothetical protein A2916_01865 [Candidatus Yanofskybacteria bacterium RIFCSPLOWO2_01_FULL_41_67]OGN30086.1 MAG: hypothetical protein A3H54_02910 